jgi:uncharacterized protein (TIGR03435 family)
MKRVATLFLFPALMQGWQGPAFEVADIKPSDPSVQKPGKGRMLPGGRIELPAQSVRDLISFAYAVQDDMIVGAPKWAGEERFDIVAKAPTSATPDTLRGMMRGLLAERFQLATHNQDKLTPAYVLTLAKDPPAIRATSGGQTRCQWTSNNDSLRRRECHNMTMEEFARELPNTGGIGITLPVKDQTGLPGGYDFEFEVGTVTRKAPEASAGGELPALEESGPTIFAALLKLGLRIQERKIMLPALAIDRVERPVKN